MQTRTSNLKTSTGQTDSTSTFQSGITYINQFPSNSILCLALNALAQHFWLAMVCKGLRTGKHSAFYEGRTWQSLVMLLPLAGMQRK